MKKVFLFFVILIILSSFSSAQLYQDLPDMDIPSMSLKEENEFNKDLMRGFLFGGLVAFILYKRDPDYLILIINSGIVFLATFLGGPIIGVIVGLVVLYKNLKK